MKLMRLRVKFFIKGLIVLVTVLLILPFLVGHLDSQEQRKAEERERELRRKFNKSYRDKRDDSLIYKEKPIAQPPPLEHKDQNDKDASMNHGHNKKRRTKNIYKNETITSKKYGPRAVLRNGVLGNFEPDDKPVNSNPGDGGKPVFVSMAEKAAADQSVQEFGFNMVASDKVAMDRNIPDTRMEECKYWHYPEELPKASVIIVFHNEGWSTLMRTVHSVINTSPPHLLEEVVMVDDFSNKPHLKGRLDEYIKQFNGKVNLYRNKERLGLIMTRTNGARYAKGDVIVFLDAHCECQKNWLVPLLARIAYDRTIMAVPIIDGIDWNNFRYSPVYAAHSHFRGIFEWGFLYKESSVPGKELVRRGEHSSMPYRSPTHAGGLFAMDRKYFFELGGYDPGLQIWGGENFELSFKIWQCGGSIEWVPCSRVGHVYRNIMPYGFGKISPKIPVVLLNYMRVVEVWLDDEFKEYFYTREPTIRGYDIGDISKQLEFKKKHNCKSFKWFMDNIAYEVYDKFPPPPPNKGWGEIKEKHGSFCWDTMGQHVGGGAIGITNCHHFGGNQLFRLNIKGQLAVGERCINARGSSEITIQYCTVDPTGPWKFKNDGSIYHTELSMCVQSDSKTNKLLLKTCDDMVDKQKWEINQVKTW